MTVGETVTMTLSEFLLARIAEDESNLPEGFDWFDCWYAPERYAREAEAKRRIVELHREGRDTDGETQFSTGCWECASELGGGYGAHWPCPTIRIVAAVYADHPGYREEWRA